MITNETILNIMEQSPGKVLLLSEIHWPTGTIYAHSSAAEKFWDNKVWLGVGQFASISTFEGGEKTGQLTLQIQVLDPLIVNEAVKDDSVGRKVKVYVAAMNDYRRIIATELIANKIIAEPSIAYGPVPVISLRCSSHRERHKSAKAYNRLTANNWRSQYPGDAYCDDIEAIGKGPLGSYSGSQSVGSIRGGGSGTKVIK